MSAACHPPLQAAFNTTLMSYGAPVLYTLSGSGATSVTPGNQAVIISGQNFGANASVVSAFYTSSFVTANSAFGTRSVTYNSTGCNVTTPNTQLTCLTAPGAGAALTWGLVVDGLASVTPVTAYLPPSLSGVVNMTGGPAVGARPGSSEWKPCQLELLRGFASSGLLLGPLSSPLASWIQLCAVSSDRRHQRRAARLC